MRNIDVMYMCGYLLFFGLLVIDMVGVYFFVYMLVVLINWLLDVLMLLYVVGWVGWFEIDFCMDYVGWIMEKRMCVSLLSCGW